MRRRAQMSSVVAVAAVLVTAGCGGSSKSSSSGPAATKPLPAPVTTTAANAPDQFRQGLINGSNFTPKQADCIVNVVLKKIGRAEFDRLYGKGNTPQRVKDIIFQASLRCAPRGAGR